jgi:hypothetical protein
VGLVDPKQGTNSFTRRLKNARSRDAHSRRLWLGAEQASLK